MARGYTPNPNRQIIGGRADVSAEELADFKRQYGQDKTLRDLLNMDKGLTRRGVPAEPDESGRYRSRRADDDSMRYRGQRSYVPTPTAPQGPTPEQLARYEEMSRPGRDAIEPIMPEAVLFGAPSAARGLAGLARGAMTPKAAKEAARPRRIEPTGLPERAPRDLVSEANRRSSMERMLERAERAERITPEFKKGGAVRGRGDGICQRGHTKGKMR